MMRRILAISAALAALFILNPAFCAYGSGKKAKADKQITVMSYNMRYAKGKDGDNCWENRRAATPAMLADCNPDVFGVQECLPEQALYVLENCPQYEGYGIGREDGVKGERTEIFWKKDKFEMLDKGTFWLCETPDKAVSGWDAKYPRTATWVLLRYKGTSRSFYFVNTHLDHKGEQARKNGLAQIHNWMASVNTEKLPVVLTGDFNLKETHPTITDFDKVMNNARLCAKKKVNDIGSFHGWGKKERRSVIDYIYYENFRLCLSFQTIDRSYLGIPYVSDHWPIMAVLKF